MGGKKKLVGENALAERYWRAKTHFLLAGQNALPVMVLAGQKNELAGQAWPGVENCARNKWQALDLPMFSSQLYLPWCRLFLALCTCCM